MARVQKALTDREVRELLKTAGTKAVGGVAGLVLRRRANAQGVVTSARWYLRKQGEGRTDISIGDYRHMGLAEARLKAMQLLNDISNGVSPIVEAKKKAKKEQAQKAQKALEALTIGEVLDEWLTYKVDRGEWGKGIQAKAEETRRKEESRIRLNVPSLLDVSVALCEPEDVAKALEPIWCSRRATCDRLCSHLHGLFRWAMTVKKCRPRGINPVELQWLKPLLPAESKRKQEEHLPALEPNQVPSLIKALVAKGSATALCTVLAILTCTRSDNIRSMRWDQISEDGQYWNIDAIDMKVTSNGQHKIPLSVEAQKILKHQREFALFFDSPYVFTSNRNNGKPLSNTTLNVLIQRLHAKEVEAGREGWLDRKQTKEKGKPVIAVQHAISRSTFETWAHETRQDERAVQLILHHEIDPRLKSAYDRSEDLPHKRKVLEAWSKFCCSMCSLDELTR